MRDVCIDCVLFFFFSSRRRHTRCSRDWSSDVCSSDLYNNSRRFASTGRIPPKMNLPRRDCSAVLLGRGTRMLLFASSAGGYRTPFLGSQEPCSLRTRSEEHTSELQSRLHLVCRLLLEKKKTYT